MLNPKSSPAKLQRPVVLVGGGSGGHITPLLSLAQELKAASSTTPVIYVGSRGDAIGDHSVFDKVYKISAGKFRRYHGESIIRHLVDLKTLGLNIRDFFRVIASFFYCLGLLGRIKPGVVFSKGSFVAVPVGLAARLKGIPIVTHDSDVVPGLANRIIGRHAKVHATGMPAEFYNYPKDKTVFTGIPVAPNIKPVTRDAQEAFKAELGISKDSKVLLVAGGGNGSVAINNHLLSIADELLSKNPKLYIFHLSGVLHQESVGREYRSILDKPLQPRVKVIGFTDEYYKYASAADLIISRAGASTIAEFAVLAKPAIIFPSAFLTGGHQLKNAEELAKIDAAVILTDEASSDELLPIINELLTSSARRQELATNISKLAKPNASKNIADIILSVARGEAA